MILHLTTELFQQNYGGIGTAVTTLYKRKSANEQFLLISGMGDRPNWLPADVHFMTYDQFNQMPTLPIQADVTFVHNVFLMRPHLPGKKIYVSHSNMEMEKQLNPTINDRFVQAFRSTLSIADEIFCVSQYEKQLLSDTNTGIVQNKTIHVAYNGCDAALAIQTPEQIARLTNEQLVYGYIGRLDARKGILNLIEDFPSDRKLLIAGGGNNKYSGETLRMMAQSLRRPEKKNITALGYCQGKRKDNFFHAVDALIVPSLYEPFGLTALEGMQFQKPVIVSKTGGLCEIFGADHPLYFDVKNPKSLKAAIDKLESWSFEQRQQLIEHQNIMLKRFSVESMLAAYRSFTSTKNE